jgi:hypothetical protein
VPRSCDRVPGKLITANPSFVFRVLSSVENPSLLGEGLTGAKSDSAARNGIRRGDTAGWWTTSPLRTTGCVKEPKPIMLRVVSAPPFGIRLRNVLPYTRVSPPESSRCANCVSFGSTRGITSLVALRGIFVRDSSSLDPPYRPSGSRRCAGLLLRDHPHGRGHVSHRPNRVRICFCGRWERSVFVLGVRQSGGALRADSGRMVGHSYPIRLLQGLPSIRWHIVHK